MQDQLKILACVLSMAVKKHGEDKPITLGHLLNICKMAQRFENKIFEKEEIEHRQILETIYTNGQD